MTYYHIYHNGYAFTYIVFGPYANGTEWDVEAHRGHVNDNSTFSTWMFTKTIDRPTNIVSDMSNSMDDYLVDQGVPL